MKKKRGIKLLIILIIIAVIIIAAVVGVKKIAGGMNNDISMRIQLQEVEKKDLSDTITLSGSVTGETMRNYTSNVQSKFLTVDVEVGDEIKKGDIIATLDKKTLQKEINSLKKAIANRNALANNQSDMNKKALADAKENQIKALADAKKDIESSRDAIRQAEDDLAYCQSLLKEAQEAGAPAETIAEIEISLHTAEQNLLNVKNVYEIAQDTYDSVKKATDEEIASAQNVIDMEKYTTDSNEDFYSQLEELKKQLEECVIVCEEDGIVTSVNAYEGGYNTPGAAIVTVENNQSMILTASVEETDILKLQEGMEAVVTAKALGDKELKGEVIKVIKIANASVGMSAEMGGEFSAAASVEGYSVQIRIEPSELISGMSAKAKVFLSKKSNVLCVPYDVIQEDDAGKYVLIAQDNKDGTYTAVRKTIEPGQEVNYYVEVAGGEIAEGDLVILDLFITEGEVFEGSTSVEGLEEEFLLY